MFYEINVMRGHFTIFVAQCLKQVECGGAEGDEDYLLLGVLGELQQEAGEGRQLAGLLLPGLGARAGGPTATVLDLHIIELIT